MSKKPCTVSTSGLVDAIPNDGRRYHVIKHYSIDQPGLAVVLNYALQLEPDPALDGRLNEAVALSLRPGSLRHDESGLLGAEKVMEALLTRTQLRQIADNADDMWLDDCAACRQHPCSGKPLTRMSVWRVWAMARTYGWKRGVPKWIGKRQPALDLWTWRIAALVWLVSRRAAA